MYSSEEARAALREIVWKEDASVPIVEGPYRYRVVVHCSSAGRQRAMFANGEHPYFCFVEILNSRGQWIERGTAIVPVLPDGRLIMAVEQRPAQGRYPDRPTAAEIGRWHPSSSRARSMLFWLLNRLFRKRGTYHLDLRRFGPYSSLEFPGGGVEPNEGLKAGFLRELTEETDVMDQAALYYTRRWPVYGFGSDLAARNFLGVVFLSGYSYAGRVATDGGLTVLALTREDVERNIRNGTIHSCQAALTPWAFYEEVERARRDSDFERELVASGYLTVERVKIAR